jgi:hypothetical protein
MVVGRHRQVMAAAATPPSFTSYFTATSDGGNFSTYQINLTSTTGGCGTAGNLLVAWFYNSNNAALPTDSAGHTWQTLSNSSQRGIYYLPSCTAITWIKEASSFANINVIVAEFAPGAIAQTVDKSVAIAASTSGTTWATASTGTLTSSNELALGYAEIGSFTLTADSPWVVVSNLVANGIHLVAAYQVVSATTALTFSGTVSSPIGVPSGVWTFK